MLTCYYSLLHIQGSEILSQNNNACANLGLGRWILLTIHLI